MIDRFGPIPTQVEDLLNSVRIKWIATKFGFEKIIMKKGKLIGYFISDQKSSFYQSKNFSKVLQFVQTHQNVCKMKEKQTRIGLRLLLTFENVKSIEVALERLQQLSKI